MSSDIKIEREFNDTVKGSVDSTPSYPHMIIGRKTKKSQLIKASIMLLVVIILLGKSIFSFPKYSVEQSFPWLMFIVFVLVVWIIFGLLVFHEKYYEFRDDDFYIYDSKKHKIQGLIAVLKNQTHKYSDHYFYKSIAHVVIRINKKYRGIGYGPEECFDVTYKFIMTNGKRFEINSSYYNQQDQNRKSVYDILENNHVHIIDKQNFKEAISQTEMPLYDYLKKNI